MRRLSRLAGRDIKLELPVESTGPRTAENIKAILGREGVLAFYRLFLAYNLPAGDFQFIVCMEAPGEQIFIVPYSVQAMKERTAGPARRTLQSLVARAAPRQ
jgi:hypothetical protein